MADVTIMDFAQRDSPAWPDTYVPGQRLINGEWSDFRMPLSMVRGEGRAFVVKASFDVQSELQTGAQIPVGSVASNTQPIVIGGWAEFLADPGSANEAVQFRLETGAGITHYCYFSDMSASDAQMFRFVAGANIAPGNSAALYIFPTGDLSAVLGTVTLYLNCILVDA